MSDLNEGQDGRTLAQGRVTNGPAPTEESTRRFFVTKVTVTVLSEDEPWDGTLDWLSYDVTKGDYVAGELDVTSEEVTAERMVTLLEEAGSDAGFFQLDEELE